MNKQAILDWAESFDSWRVVPRIVLFSYGGWLAYTTDRLLNWYMALPTAAQTTQASSFCFGAITAITTIAGYVYRVYSDSGRQWDNNAGSTRTSSSVTETVVK